MAQTGETGARLSDDLQPTRRAARITLHDDPAKNPRDLSQIAPERKEDHVAVHGGFAKSGLGGERKTND